MIKRDMTLYKIIIVSIISIVILFVILLNKTIFNFFDFSSPMENKDVEFSLSVEYGMPVRKIAEKLKDAGLIDNEYKFLIYHKLHGKSSTIKPGVFQLSSSMGTKDIYNLLTQTSFSKKIFIPEGITILQTAQILEKNNILDSKESFINLCSDRDFIREMRLKGVQSLEGFLFPDTYDFPPGLPTEYYIKKMYAQFLKNIKKEAEYIYKDIYDEQTKILDMKKNIKIYPTKTNLTFYEILKLSSMVERESMFYDDKLLVSSVLTNRFKKNHLLQCDATIHYAVNQWGIGLTKQDLEIESPYNTYKNYGLPPTPICSPGMKSLMAVVNQPKTNYLYYCLINGTWRHAFTAKFEDHAKSAQRYRKAAAKK